MIKIIIALAFLCGAVFLGPRLADSQGFVHIATNDYIIETSLTTAVIIAVIAFVVLHIVINVLFRSIHLPKSTAKWFGATAAKRKLHLQNEAFMAYEEGAYGRALSLLKKSGVAKLPTHCLFLGAKCAFETNDLEACRKFLDRAEERPDGSDLACKLLRAKLNLKLDNTEAALENLEAIEKDSYSSAITTKLLYECYEKDNNYAKIAELLPNLKGLKIFDDANLERITLNCLNYKLGKAQSAEEVSDLVDKLSRGEKHNPNFMLPVIKRLVKLEDMDKATKYAVTLVKNHDDDAVYELLATWPEASSSLLNTLESKVNDADVDAEHNAPLLQALANLEMRSEHFDEAKSHLDRAIALKDSRENYLLAAELCKRTNQPDEANKYLSLALENH